MTTEPLRLLWAVSLVLIPFLAAYRFSRKLAASPDAIADALLLTCLVQYLCVGLAGLLAILNPVILTLEAALATAALFFAADIVPRTADPRRNFRTSNLPRAIIVFTIGCLAALIFSQRFYPPLATDVLTYHLPAAIFWLQHHRLGLFPAWFFNPANTFSPLAGSMFITWLLAPVGNDSLARFVQAIPWLLLLFSMLSLARGLGASPLTAALIAAATVLSRPFLSESIIAKDDLFVAAFFIAAIAQFARSRRCERFSALRIGIAIGLLLAVKYTAFLCIPVLLLLIDAPHRAGWRGRQWVVAISAIILLAGPWYLRNLVCFHNPLFPVQFAFFPGEMPPHHDSGNLWNVMTASYYSMPSGLLILLLILWLLALVMHLPMLIIDPVRRTILVGPPLAMILFSCFSPQPEVRFLLPAFALLFATLALLPFPAALLIAILAIATSFAWANIRLIETLALWGLVIALIAHLLNRLDAGVFRYPIVTILVLFILLLTVLLHWTSYLVAYRDQRAVVWQSIYPADGDAWKFVDTQIPPDAIIAYTNQFMIDPLYGFALHHTLLYAPVRPGETIATLHLSETGDDLNTLAARAANSDPDQSTWRRNLYNSRAQYLIIGHATNAPELPWALSDPADFQKIDETPAATIFKITSGINFR